LFVSFSVAPKCDPQSIVMFQARTLTANTWLSLPPFYRVLVYIVIIFRLTFTIITLYSCSNEMCNAGVAILLRQRTAAVNCRLFSRTPRVRITPNAHASELCNFHSSQFANVAAGRGLCNTSYAKGRNDEFVLGFVILRVMGPRARLFSSFLCDVGVSVSVFQFAINTPSDSKCGRCFFSRYVICVVFLIVHPFVSLLVVVWCETDCIAS